MNENQTLKQQPFQDLTREDPFDIGFQSQEIYKIICIEKKYDKQSSKLQQNQISLKLFKNLLKERLFGKIQQTVRQNMNFTSHAELQQIRKSFNFTKHQERRKKSFFHVRKSQRQARKSFNYVSSKNADITFILGAIQKKSKNKPKKKQFLDQIKIHSKFLIKPRNKIIKTKQQPPIQQKYKQIHAFNKSICQSVKLNYLNRFMICKYLEHHFNQRFANWFCSFFQLRQIINFTQFQLLQQNIKKISFPLHALITYLIFDYDQDGKVTQNDLFNIMKDQNKVYIPDLLKIIQFQKQQKMSDQQAQEFKIEQIILSDFSLTYKDYKSYFKKVDKPFLVTEVKKDTAFHRSVAILQHREQVRHQRKQIQLQKNKIQRKYKPKAQKDDNALYYRHIYKALKGESFIFSQLVRILFGTSKEKQKGN